MTHDSFYGPIQPKGNISQNIERQEMWLKDVLECLKDDLEFCMHLEAYFNTLSKKKCYILTVAAAILHNICKVFHLGMDDEEPKAIAIPGLTTGFHNFPR